MPKYRKYVTTEAKYDITQLDENSFATPEQKAIIKQLSDEIRILVPDVNRLWSLGVSVAIIPLIIVPLIFWKRSPFYGFYEHFYLSYYKIFNEKINSDFYESYPQIDETGEDFRIATNRLAEIHDVVLPHADNIHFIQKVRTTLVNLDRLPPTDPNLIQMKAMLIRVYNQAYAAFPSNRWEGEKMLLSIESDEASKLTLTEIYGKVCDQMKFYDKKLTALLTRAGARYATKNTALSIEFLFKPLKVLLSTATQYLVVDNFLRSLNPYGLLRKAPETTYKNAIEAEKVINELTKLRNDFHVIAGNNISNARVFSYFAVPLAVILLSTVANPSAELILFAITLAATALKNSTDEIRNWNKNRKSANSLQDAENNLRAMLSGCNDYVLILKEGHTRNIKECAFETSQFQINFNYEKEAELFIESLIEHGVKFILTSANKVILAANCIPKDLRKIADIQNVFSQSLECQEQIDKLKVQIKRLSAKVQQDDHEYFSVSSYNKLPMITIQFSLPMSWAANRDEINLALSENLKGYGSLNNDNKLLSAVAEVFDQKLYISFHGNKSLKEKDFFALQSMINKILNEKRENQVPENKKPEDNNIASLPDPKATTTLNETSNGKISQALRNQDAGDEKLSLTKTKKDIKPQQVSDAKIKNENTQKNEVDIYKNARLFNISEKENEAKRAIYAITGKGIRDSQSDDKTYHYIRNGLGENTPVGINNLANAVISNGLSFVRSVGAVGVVKHSGRKDGVRCSFKIKSLGKGVEPGKNNGPGKASGDGRFFATIARGANGEPITDSSGTRHLYEIFSWHDKTHKKHHNKK